MSFGVDDVIGAYKIISVLGRGGAGQVFKAEHTITRRIEALKIATGGQPADQEQAQRFLREIQVHASLIHPNIASVHHAFWWNEDLVMVMELVEGESLQKRMERERIPLAETIRYACQTLRALSYAHARGVVHRDVSPANIIITPDGTVKLTDFGLAKTPADLRLTPTGAVLGSLYYVSPEQVMGSTAVDARADIYSLGAVLYELVVGQKPFDLDTAFSLMRAHVEQLPVVPSDIDPTLPLALSRVILTALAKKPEARFCSADALREALESLGLGASDPPSAARDATRMTLRAGVAWVLLTALLSLLWKPVFPPARLEAVARAESADETLVPAPETERTRTNVPESTRERSPRSNPRTRKGGSRVWRSFKKMLHLGR